MIHEPFSPLRRIVDRRRPRANIAAAMVAVVALALATPTAAQATPVPASGVLAAPKIAASVAAAPKDTTSARPACDTEVAPDHARCFALVQEIGGVTPHLDQPSGLAPADIHSAYHLPPDGGAGLTIAVVDAFDNPNATTDLAFYRQSFGLRPLAPGQFRKVDQRGGTDYPEPNAGWATEIALDLDAVTAVAPDATILLVEADSNSFADLGAAVNQAVALGAQFISNSYGTAYTGTPGSGEDASLRPLQDQFYNHPGVVITASTGDSGFGVSFPASSSYVTTVGGTTLVRDSSTRGWTESVWHGAGSGCSVVFDKPVFQTDAGCPKRSVSDVSAVADPNTGLAVYHTYQSPGWIKVGGTSLSAPLIAATYALGGRPVVGSYPNSYPYAATGGLNDVTTGDNGTCTPAYLCTAGPGYDGPTGLGTPDGTKAFSRGPRGLVSGRITDAVTRAGLAGATVAVGTGDTSAQAVSAADGSYQVSIPPGAYPVSVSGYGYRTATAGPVTVTDGGTVTLNVALRTAPSRTVSGTVTDGSGHGYPLYARIDVTGAPGGPLYTDPYTGRYSVDLPQGSTFTLTISSMYPGYLPGSSTFRVGGADLIRDLRLRVDPDATGVAGYTVRATGTTQTFDATTVPPGWTVTDTADSPGWVFADAKPRGNLTGGSGGFAIVDSDLSGSSKSQNTFLTTPTVDLSAATDPLLEFDTYYRGIGGSLASTGTVEVTGDGTTWTTVWSQTTATVSGHVKIHLPAAVKTAAAAVRFHYVGHYSWYWELDNVFVGSKRFVPVHGGLLAGRVTDANTGAGINGATVTADENAAVTATSSPTSDPAIGDGFYWLFSPLTGDHSVTARKRAYGAVTTTVGIGANTTTRADYPLPAGRIGIATAPVSATVDWGGTTTADLTLTNTGALPATVRTIEQPGGFVIRSRAGAPTTVTKAEISPLSAVVQARKDGAGSSAATPVAPPVTAADAWQAVADYPTTIQDAAAATVDGIVYSVGGYDGSDDSKALYAYDPAVGSWTRKADSSETREAAAAVAVGGRMVLTSGWGPTGQPDGKTEIYDPAADSWSPGSVNPGPHAAAGHAAVNGKIYLVGGCSATACGSTDVQVYDVAANAWSSVAPYPESMGWQSCGAIDGKVYCAGGSGGASTTRHGYVYDPVSDSWSPIADLPTDQWGTYHTAANDQLVVAGGAVNNSSGLTNQAWAYDPTTDQWTALPNLNAALYRGAGALGFYAIGGSPGGIGSSPVSRVQLLPGYDRSGGEDVPWLSVDPTQLTIGPGASATITVTFDASVATVTQPGTYMAGLRITTDTPYPGVTVPLSMTVRPPSTWGKVTGTVSTVVSGKAVPIAGATVEIDSWAGSYTLTTTSDGGYALWLDERNNPLTMIVAKDGYRPQTAAVRIGAGRTLVKNWTLLKR